MNRSELARGLGIDPSLLLRIERGDVALTAARAKEIARLLGISIARLYGEIPASAGVAAG